MRNFQLQSRPRPGEKMCLGLLRDRIFGERHAVAGFEVTGLDGQRVSIRPAYLQVDRSAVAAEGAEIFLGIGFIAGSQSSGESRPASSTTIELGGVRVGGVAVQPPDEPVTMFWPTTGLEPDILRIAAVVRESKARDAVLPDRSRMNEVFQQTDRWE